MREYIQGPDGFYPDRALPKLGATDPGTASLSGAGSIGLTGAASLSLRVALAGSAAFGVSSQADLSITEATAIVRGAGLASTQPRLTQLTDPELARYRESLEEDELTIILQIAALYIQHNP